MAQLRPVAELNQLAASAFAQALQPLFEAAGPLAGALHAERPFASYAELLDCAESVAGGLTPAEQIEVVNAHPRIGESAETVRRTSDLSYREQGYDREASVPRDELQSVYEELASLNRAYERRFGFRFVIFVSGRPKSEILDVLRERIHNSRDAELGTGLRAIFLIARDRLSSLTVEPPASPGVASTGMQQHGDNAARLAVLDQLRRSALDTYGEERCADANVEAALNLAATAIWRVSQERLEPLGNEPLPTHG
ncbi:MAG: 2-oxo-4-hydroxy-4-carboxy-5-ureidoimidazoline decarboxylase [Chloroflexota bacterium]|nr:2-oxo-4-hydroxy-4-carboxy-5-ureidoimidazoline decarboxylase [Chloroflexota bacterium]